MAEYKGEKFSNTAMANTEFVHPEKAKAIR